MQSRQGKQTDQHGFSCRFMLVAGTIAAAGFALVSVAANFQFGMSLASTPFDQAIYVALSIAADLMKMALPLIVIILWRTGERIFALAGALFWIGAVAYSVSAAIGFAASTRSQTVASQYTLLESRKAWAAKITRIEDRIDRLGTPRPANVIEAEIDSLLRTPGAEGCKKINGPITHEICPKVDRLREELATSKEAAHLEADLVADRKALLEKPRAPSVVDPQSAMLSRVTGMTEDAIRSAIAMLISLLVELGSALGFTLTILASSRPVPDQRAQASEKPTTTASRIGHQLRGKERQNLQITKTPADLVTRWALDRLDIVGTGKIQADDAFKDFRRWCLAYDLIPLTPQMFGRQFTKVHAEMGGRKVRRRGRAYYEGASLQVKYEPGIQGKEKSAAQVRP